MRPTRFRPAPPMPSTNNVVPMQTISIASETEPESEGPDAIDDDDDDEEWSIANQMGLSENQLPVTSSPPPVGNNVNRNVLNDEGE